MNADGTGKKQLTDRLGYDGGAFYNSNGSKIVWRAYYPESEKEISDYETLLAANAIRPMALQIWTMNSDGTNKKQITDNGAANFGPFFHPNGKKIIFSSNVHDEKGRDFDLYTINVDGTGLERITHYNGFEGFPNVQPRWEILSFGFKPKSEKNR